MEEAAKAWASDSGAGAKALVHADVAAPPAQPPPRTPEQAKTQTAAPTQTQSGCAPDPLVGTLLDRRYRVEALLGRGGMGAVYRGEQVFTRRPVALKVLHPSVASQDEVVERFRREAQIAVRLQSAHVVDVLDFGHTDDGRAFLVMELLRGESLQQLLRREGRLAPARAVPLLRELLLGLRAVHAAGIVHRDLKPDNIWLAPDAAGGTRLKLLDFGIAKLSEPPAGSAQTQLGIVMGTPAYLSPEQAFGYAIDHRADLYSVGILAFVLLTGRHPFPADDARSLLAAHAMQQVPPLAQAAPELAAHPELAALVARATEKEPAARAQSADELLALLPQQVPESEAPTQIAPRLKAAELSAAGGGAQRLVPLFPAHAQEDETLVALKHEGQELLRTTQSALRDGSRQAVSATLTTALWLTRATRWLVDRTQRAVRWSAPRLQRALLALARGAQAAWRLGTGSRRGRLVSVAVLACVVVCAGLVFWWQQGPLPRARRALEEGQPGLALTALADADASDPEVLVLRGRVLHAMKRGAEGLAAYKGAAAKDGTVWRRAEVLADLVDDLVNHKKEAGELLAAAGERALAPLLEAAGDAKSYRRRWAAIEQLRRLGHEDRVDLVAAYIADLRSDDCEVVTRACRKLADLGDVRALEPLRVLAHQPDSTCGASAARSARRKLEGTD